MAPLDNQKCRLFHRWSRWSELKFTDKAYYYSHYQERTCGRCGKIQVRTVMY